MNPRKSACFLTVLMVGAMFGAAGCRDNYPHSFAIAGGKVERSHGKPMEGGYYTNWDPYAATIEITPMEDVNPVCTQHVFVVTVKDHEGEPLPTRRVEWMIPEGCVGTFVEVDESGAVPSRGHKIDNTFAVSHTNTYDHVITRGNDDPSDDVHLERGQTWAVITSPVEGTTHVIAYAPGIYDWKNHKVFAKKHWIDAIPTFPKPAINPIGTTHTFTTSVAKHSDNSPLAGFLVTYKILDGPKASFANGKQEQTVKTGANGQGSVVLKQAQAVEGVNNVQVSVKRPAMDGKPEFALATALTSKTWIGPKINITKAGPATALQGETFVYKMIVTNPGKIDATNTTVVDTLPAGLAYVSSDPKANVSGQKLTWKLGNVPINKPVPLAVTVKGTKNGTFTNVAKVTADHGLADTAEATTLISSPALAVEKTGPELVECICRPIVYTVVVKNPGSAPAQNVVLVDKLPAGMTWQGKTEIRQNLGTIAPGASKIVKIPVKVTKAGTYTNPVVATADGGLEDTDKATTKVLLAKLAIDKKGPATRFVGRNVAYSVKVTNTGNGPAENTVLTDMLGKGVRLVKASDGGKLVGGKVIWDLGTLKAGASKTVNLEVKPLTKGKIINTAVASANCVADVQDEVVTIVKGIPALLLECIDGPDPVEVGTNTTYVITVKNQGSEDDTNIVIKCVIPKEQKFISATASVKETVKGSAVTFAPVKTIAPGAIATFKVVTQGVKGGDSRFKVTMTSDQLKTPVEETESTRIYADE